MGKKQILYLCSNASDTEKTTGDWKKTDIAKEESMCLQIIQRGLDNIHNNREQCRCINQVQ